jgi:hypothetical protein
LEEKKIIIFELDNGLKKGEVAKKYGISSLNSEKNIQRKSNVKEAIGMDIRSLR